MGKAEANVLRRDLHLAACDQKSIQNLIIFKVRNHLRDRRG